MDAAVVAVIASIDAPMVAIAPLLAGLCPLDLRRRVYLRPGRYAIEHGDDSGCYQHRGDSSLCHDSSSFIGVATVDPHAPWGSPALQR
jgi:hypothetical protein